MKKYNRNEKNNQEENSNWSIIEEVLRKGAREMLQTAIETEVIDYIDKYKHIKNKKGYRAAVRNGYLPERDILTGIGPISIKQPRVDDR